MYRFLYNCVFCLAFINFLIYWIYLFFSETNNNKLTYVKPFVLEKTSPVASFQAWVSTSFIFKQNDDVESEQWGKIKIKYLDNLCFIISSTLWFVLTLLILFRIIQCYHFPLANFYEALIFLTWCLITLNLIILLEPTNTSLFQFSVQKQISGAILAPCILFIIAFAQFNLEETITPLVPALKSNWLLMHVSIMICSYTTFMVGGLLAFFLLIQTFYSYFQKTIKIENFTNHFSVNEIKTLSAVSGSPYRSISKSKAWPGNIVLKNYEKGSHNTQTIEYNSINNSSNFGFPSFDYILEGPYKMQKKNLYILLDNLSYRMMGIGFPLFTLGILSGAVWANEAWGSYWSWDIKEVGSFINWLLVALYFHCRYKNFIMLSHTVAFISLIVLFFNFFGISLGIFGSSLHAYGAAS